MPAQQVVPGLYQINLSYVNAYLFEAKEGLILIDTGLGSSAKKILDAVQSLGKQASDVKYILVTHLHGDHTGSLAKLKQATGAPAYMHPLDAELVRQGIASRPAKAAPGLINKLLGSMMSLRGEMTVDPAEIEHEIDEGQPLPFAEDLQVIHVPGHSAGQIAFLWQAHGGVLIAADTCGNMMGLGYPPIFEDEAKGLQSLKKLAGLSFNVAVFGHGKPLLNKADQQFKQKWGKMPEGMPPR